MPYQYTLDTNEDKVVFRRLGAGCARFFFLFAGILFTFVGYCLIAYVKRSDEVLSMIKVLFPLFGCIAIYVGIRLPKLQGKTIPDQLIFDNPKGRIEITQQASDIKTGYIYYDEIVDFIVKTKSQSSDNRGRRYYTYHVYLTKKDGGSWELLKRNSEKAALEEIATLKRTIRLAQTPQRVTLNLNDSPKYTLSKGLDKTELSWRNKLGSGPLVLALFSGVFIAILSTILRAVLSPGAPSPFFAYLVLGFIGSVFLFVVGGNAWKMIKNSKTEYALTITNQRLEYIERSFEGLVRKTTQIPLSELHAIAFSFDSDTTQRSIRLYTHQQFVQKDTLGTSLSLDSIKEAFQFQKDLVELDIQGITPVEAVHIEHYLKQHIEEKASRKVA